MTASCRKVRGQLPWFAGGELAAADAAAVRAHLCACQPCRTEASALVRSVRALRAANDAVLPGVDDAFFARSHRAVLARVAAEADAAGGTAASRAPRLRWLPRVAAAAALFAFGLWLARPAQVPSLLERPAVAPYLGTGVRAVPWAGPRAMQPLSFDTREEVPGRGLMGRLVLRTLEDFEGTLVPPPPRRKNAAKDAAKDAQPSLPFGKR